MRDKLGIESDDVVSTSKRGKLGVVLVLIVILVVVIAAIVFWLTLPPQEEGPRVYTMAEYFYSAPHVEPSGTVFIIEDSVAESRSIITPRIKWNTTVDFFVDPTSRMNFTLVEFESITGLHFRFMGNRSLEFPAGQPVRFDIKFQEYDYGNLTKVETELDYCFKLLVNYDFVIRVGGYSPIHANVTIDSGNVTIRFTDFEDVYPLPANWNQTDVVLLDNNLAPVLTPGNGSLYDGGNFVGDLIGSTSLANFSINIPYRVGQELRIPYDGTYVAVRFMATQAIGFVYVT